MPHLFQFGTEKCNWSSNCKLWKHEEDQEKGIIKELRLQLLLTEMCGGAGKENNRGPMVQIARLWK